MSKRRVLLVLLIAIPLLVFAAWCYWPAVSPVTLANAQRVHSGMSRAEVEAILGAPHTIRSNGPHLWQTGEFLVSVYYDERGRVIGTNSLVFRIESSWERLLRMFR